VAGIERHPRPVTRRMGKKKIKQRSKIKSFVKVYNYNHLMPTRLVGCLGEHMYVHLYNVFYLYMQTGIDSLIHLPLLSDISCLGLSESVPDLS